ncbi:MAG: hypothetical protein EPN21_17865 [Methylococcaceae bacterium]|nr:MAG: hypothetical protein EPN21_17865 [Methylococcaceae bacterium]
MNKLTPIITLATLAVLLTSAPAFAANYCNSVWTGKVERLRIYNQGANQKVFAYIAPGNNDSYVGYSENPNMINALFQNRNNQSGDEIQGYTGSDCKIQWLDY